MEMMGIDIETDTEMVKSDANSHRVKNQIAFNYSVLK